MCYYVNIKFLEVDRNRRDVHLFMDSFFWGGGFEVIFSLMSVIVIGMFIVVAVKGIGQWNKNNQSPRLTVPASVTAKRTNVSRHQHANAGDVTGAHGFHSTSTTSYYVTFQVESGQDGAVRDRQGIWDAFRGRCRQAEFSGNQVSWV